MTETNQLFSVLATLLDKYGSFIRGNIQNLGLQTYLKK